MSRLTVREGQIYKHFKGNMYEVVAVATHTETEESLVIYKPCDGEKCFARPLEMFLSEVDHVKYPDVKVKYRFALVGVEDGEDISPVGEGIVDQRLEKLLDSKYYGEKAEILYSLRDSLTKEMIRTICITHDIELNSTEIEDQYEELRSYMLTMEKYESTRLR